MELMTVSALEKVLPFRPVRLARTGGKKLAGEDYAFQVVLRVTEPVQRCRLTWDGGLGVSVARERYTTSLYTRNPGHDDYVIGADEAVFPDALIPYASEEFSLGTGVHHTFWVTVRADDSVVPGTYDLTFTAEDLSKPGEGAQCAFHLTVLSGSLAENDLIVTKWIHGDCIAEANRVPVFGEAFYTAFRAHIRAAVASGQTMAYLPLFTPPLDTAVGGERMTVQSVSVTRTDAGYTFGFQRFDRLVAICREEGIRYFELSHLFTQWGAEACPKIEVTRPDGTVETAFGWGVASDSAAYTAFLAAFLPALTAHLSALGIKDRTYLHLSDEPDARHITRYVALHRTVKQYAAGLKTMDALSEYRFAEAGAPDLPAVIEGSEGEFMRHGTPFLLYYCCYPNGKRYPNIFMNHPLLRVRILGAMLYLTGARGFLHWGFNFYHNALSRQVLDPFVSCDGLETFPAGDPFVVYPDGALGVYSSVRQEVFAAAIGDYRLLKRCEEMLGRDGVLALLRRHGILSLTEYPTDEGAFEALRDELLTLAAGT